MRIYLWIIVLILFMMVMLGFAVPTLISAKSDIAVLSGVSILLLTGIVVPVVVIKIIRMFKSNFKENDKI